MRIIYDKHGESLVIWLDDPAREDVCEETESEVILMKDADGRVIGMEVMNFHPNEKAYAVTFEEF